MSNMNPGFAVMGDARAQARRSPMEMVCDILGVLSDGPTKPTHILYKANMSWKVLSSYLDYLRGRGLVEKEEQGGKRSTYKLTDRGKSILKLYEGLRTSLSEEEGNGGRELLGLLGERITVESRQTSSNW